MTAKTVPYRYFHDIRVPEGWREALLAEFPGISDPEVASLRRLVGAILLGAGAHPDGRDSTRMVVSRDLLAWCMSRSPRHHGLVVDPILQALADTFPLVVYEHRYTTNEARTVAVPADVATRYAHMFDVMASADDLVWVNLVSGNVWTHRDDAAVRDARDRARQNYTSQFSSHQAFPVLQHMNTNVPDRLFVPDPVGIAEVRQVLATMDPESGHVKHNRNCLRRLMYGPVVAPLYRPSRSGNTCRVFAGDHPALSISSVYRRQIYPRFIDVDVESCHAAAACRLWGTRKLDRLLRDGGSLWATLLADLGCGPDYKAAIKTSFLATLYGAMVDDGFLMDQGIITDSDLNARFLAHELIREVIDCRNSAMERIREDGYAINIHGQRKRHRWVKGQGENVRMLLAWQATSVELELMLQVLNVAQSRSDVQLALWQHDGAGIVVRRAADRPAIVRALSRAVDAKAKELEIPTRLVVKAG